MSSEDKPRDRWSKAEIIVGAVSGILLPIVVAVVGGIYTYNQDKNHEANANQEHQNEEVRRRADRATTLLKHFASDSKRERLLAIKVAEQLAKEKQLPDELVPAMIEIAKNDPSAEVSGAATEATNKVTEVTTINQAGNLETVQSTASQTLAKLPPRVYMHIRNESQRGKAEQIAAKLQERGFIVPGIERLDAGPANAELRYFNGSEPVDTQALVNALNELGLKVNPVDLSNRYKNSTSIRPRHYELWVDTNSLR
ncbi:MAG TPA: hypothetical protein VF538_19910 [Pyrinomonadaceae bacterium]|jgi:hypothetical protein